MIPFLYGTQAELVAVDEAAAIPLPLVKKLLGPYLVFLSSTITGYEGTGRSLSLKLVSQLREQQGKAGATRKLKELTLDVPIRYGQGDPVERWLYDVLCLDAQIANHRIVTTLPLQRNVNSIKLIVIPCFPITRSRKLSYNGSWLCILLLTIKTR